MKRISGKLLFPTFLVFILIGCTSGKRALERGDYYDAVLKSVDRLRSNPDHKKSSDALRQAYPLALNWFETRINNLKASNDPFKWSGTVQSYESINVMYEEIMRSPGALRIIPNPKNYYSELELAKKNAAEEYYSAGMTELNKGTREDAKTAYRYFQRVNDYVRNYKDVNDKIEEAKWMATLKVVIQPIPAVARNLEVSAEFFENKITDYLHNNQVSEFVRFYTPTEAEAVGLSNPDQVIALSFDEFTVGQVYFKEEQIPMEKDSVVVGTYRSGGNDLKTTESLDQNQSNSVKVENYSNNLVANKEDKGEKKEEKGKPEKGDAENKGNEGGDKTKDDKEKEKSKDDNPRNDPNTNKPNNQEDKEKGGKEDKSNKDKNAQGNSGNQKVTICHKTGNSFTTISVSQAAVEAHLRHGDKMGDCSNTSGNNTDQNKENQTGNTGNNQPNQNQNTQNTQQGNQNSQNSNNQTNQGNPNSQNDRSGEQTDYTKTSGNNEGQNTQGGPGKDVPVYGTVKVTVFKYTKTITSGGVLDFRVVDAFTNKVVTQEKLPGEFIWRSEWATFNGDERALTPQYLELSKLKEAPAPPPQTLFVEFTKPIYDQILNKIVSYYRNY